ncbi:hypothetical protein TKK_0003526 [Trichogramma kaykai]
MEGKSEVSQLHSFCLDRSTLKNNFTIKFLTLDFEVAEMFISSTCHLVSCGLDLHGLQILDTSCQFIAEAKFLD